MASIQVICSELTGTATTGGTWYHPITGNYSVWSTLTNGFQSAPWSVAGSFRNFVLNVTTAPGTGKSVTFTLYKNGTNTDLAVTISGTDTSGRDTAHSVAVVPGDILCLKYQPTASMDVGTILVSYEFEPTVDGQSGYTNANQTGPSTSAVTYLGPFGALNWNATLANRSNVVPIAGTLTRLDVLLNGTAGPTGSDGYVFAYVLDGVLQDGSGGTVDTRVSVLGTATSGSATFSLAVTAGQVVAIASTPAGTPTSRYAGIGTAFTATTVGEFIVANHPSAALGNSGTYYCPPANAPASGWFSGESGQVSCSATAVVLDHLYLVLSAAPGSGGSGDSYTLSLRKNTSSPTGAPSVMISETATIGSDLVGSLSLADGDVWSMRSVPASTPATTPNASWAMRGIACAWVDIANVIPVPIDFDRYPGGTAKVSCHLWTTDAGVPMKARLYDGSSSLGESKFVTATTPTSTQFSVSGSGTKTVRLQIYGKRGADLFCKSGGLIV